MTHDLFLIAFGAGTAIFWIVVSAYIRDWLDGRR